MENTTPIVPKQEAGVQKDTGHTAQFDSPEAAQEFFRLARQRLFDVNNWKNICQGLSSDFKLYDAQGQPVNRLVQKGDYFQIDIPGPGTVAGQGYDWVQVEAVEDRQDTAGETAFLRVRPAASPLQEASEVAHFLDSQASSTFLVTRSDHTVRAEVHGRNEKSNTETAGWVDKVRNAVTSLGAWLGFADVQWKNLAVALVAKD